MEFTYRLTRDDLQRFQELIEARADAQGRGFLPILAWAGLPVGALIVWLAWQDAGRGGEGLFVALLTTATWGVYLIFLVAQAVQSLRSTPPDSHLAFAERHVKVDAGGVERFSPAPVKWSWLDFDDVSDHESGVVLWFGESNSGTFIPAKAFASEAARRELVRMASEHIARERAARKPAKPK